MHFFCQYLINKSRVAGYRFRVFNSKINMGFIFIESELEDISLGFLSHWPDVTFLGLDLEGIRGISFSLGFDLTELRSYWASVSLGFDLTERPISWRS